MNKLIWSDNWSVGSELLDSQHEAIVRIINTLIEHRHESVTSELVSDVLNELTQYASKHFRSEEELLESVSYPDIEKQKRQHREFRVKLVQFCTATYEHVEGVPEVLLNWLTQWWYEHINEEDRLYRDYL